MAGFFSPAMRRDSVPAPLAAARLPAALATFPASWLPALPLALRLPVPGHPDMAPTGPVPEPLDPEIANSRWGAWSFDAHRRRLDHDNAAILMASLMRIGRHHAAGQPGAEHQHRHGQRTSHRESHLGRCHGGHSAQRRPCGRTDQFNEPARACADGSPLQRGNWRRTKAQISAEASGPVGSLKGSDLAAPLHAWPMPVTSASVTTVCRPTR